MSTEIMNIKNAGSTNSVTTTLFDLISDMQEHATQPADEALIVPTIAEWLRTGKITRQSDRRLQPAA